MTAPAGSGIHDRASVRLVLVVLLLTVALAAAPPAAAQELATPPTPAPLPLQSDDAAIATAVRERLGQLEGLGAFRVTVEGGVVHLIGEAETVQARREAGALVRRLEGVAEVENELEVSAALSEQVEGLLQTLRAAWVLLPVVGFALAVLLLFVALAWLAGRWTGLFRVVSSNPFLRDVTRGVVRFVLVLIGLVLALEVLDLTAVAGALVGTAGLIGVVLGFAFRDVAENYVAGILLSLRQPFAANDFIAVDEFAGRVVRMTTRATILMTLDGNHLRVPNARVFSGVVVNYTRNPRRRFTVEVGIATDADLAEAQEVGIRVLREMPGVLEEPPAWSQILELGDSSVRVAFHGWIDQTQVNYFRTWSEAIRLVKEGLEADGIELPEPIYRLRMEDGPAAERRRTGRPADMRLRADIAERGDPIVDQIEAERRSAPGADLLDPAAPQE